MRENSWLVFLSLGLPWYTFFQSHSFICKLHDLLFLYSQIKSHRVYVLHFRGHLAASIVNIVNGAAMLPVQG